MTKVDAVHGSGKRVLLFGSALLTFTLASRSETRCTSKLKNCIATTASHPRKPWPGTHPQVYPLPFCLLWPDGHWFLTCSWDFSLGNLELTAKSVSSSVVQSTLTCKGHILGLSQLLEPQTASNTIYTLFFPTGLYLPMVTFNL